MSADHDGGVVVRQLSNFRYLAAAEIGDPRDFIDSDR